MVDVNKVLELKEGCWEYLNKCSKFMFGFQLGITIQKQCRVICVGKAFLMKSLKDQK